MDPIYYERKRSSSRSYVKVALGALAAIASIGGLLLLLGVADSRSSPAPGRQLKAVRPSEAYLDRRFDELLESRLAELAQKSCNTIPDPTIRQHDIVFDLPTAVNAVSLPELTVVEGDTLSFTNTDQNPYTNERHTEPWFSDVWQASVEDYEACNIIGTKPTEATKRLFWGTDLQKGEAIFSVPAVNSKSLLPTALYFTAANGWKKQEKWGWCSRGLKLKVNILPRPTVVKCDGGFANLFLEQSAQLTPPGPPPPGPLDDKIEDIEMITAQQADMVDDLTAAVQTLSKKVSQRSSTISVLSQMQMLAQQQTEHRVRSEGSSGIVDVRGFKGGIDAYADSSFVGRGVGAIHNHGNFKDTMGMGEVEVVLNGVMFKTRHNDYRLQTPSYSSGEYGATDPIAFPAVPDRVKNMDTVAGEIEEMQKWFEAWKLQDPNANADGIERDYTQHFRPVLCYLEGAWITDDGLDLKERDPDSDRHALEASNMLDLHNKTMYMANSGRKNTRENLAFMPSSVRRLVLDADTQDAVPEVANFESRIACQLLKDDVPTDRFRVAQDLHVQLSGRPLTREELGMTRKARYELHPAPKLDGSTATWDNTANVHQRREYEYLDVLMEQVAGKDNNVAGNELFDDLEGNRAKHHQRIKEDLDVSKYSRFYQLAHKDAMGFQSRRRGFSDRYMWAARTTQEKVSPVTAKFGKKKHDDKLKVNSEQRWTYAIPLEITYLTPLTNWNPYNIVDHTPEQPTEKAVRNKLEKVVTADGHDGEKARLRNGKCDLGERMAFNGVKRSLFYRTPIEFFEKGQSKTADPADTSGSAAGVCVLDASGVVRNVAASGHHVFIPSVAGGVGTLRQRYPIMPLHVDGSTAFKETKALAAIILGLPDDDDHDHAHPAGHYETARGGMFGDNRDDAFGFDLVLTGGTHEHAVTMTATKLKLLEEREEEYKAAGSTGKIPKVMLMTEERNAHRHAIAVSRRVDDSGIGGFVYTLEGCKSGGHWSMDCVDGHDALERSGALTASLKRLNRL